MTLSPLHLYSWCVVSAYTWLALWLSLLSTCTAGVWWAHTLDWLYDSLSSPPVQLVCGERIHLIGSMTLPPLHLYSWCVVSAYTWLALWLYLLSTCTAGVWWAHTLDWLYDSISSPPVHTLDWLYDSLSSPPVSGVWWAHTLDWLYESLSSPPVSGVWWAHTLDWLYESLSSPPVSGVWWEHTLDWLYDSLSSPPVAGVWWAHTLDWLYDSLSSPPVAGVWWAHWRRCPVAAVASSKWMLHTDGGWGETPHMIVKRFGCTTIHNKPLYTCIIHSFIHSQWSRPTLLAFIHVIGRDERWSRLGSVLYISFYIMSNHIWDHIA